MRFPLIVPAHNLARGWPVVHRDDGQWTPARPEPPSWAGNLLVHLPWRLKIAWLVFTGEYDALRWSDVHPKVRD